VHPPHVKAAALELIEAGHNDCEVSRMLGVPRRTIMDWRRPRYVRQSPVAFCPRCWRATRPVQFSAADYAELLGIYLGDGSISAHPRTQRLRIALDSKYPGIVSDVMGLLRRCFPRNDIGLVRAKGCVHVSLYSSHLSCLFPQHGSGPKHERPIVLEHWQQELVEAEPWPFIRGCIRTDGCAFINRTDVHRDVPYEYLSYQFANMSRDIVDLFVAACNSVGVFTRVNRNARGLWDVRINRRQSVALMLEHVGTKR
jgi:hypothetical protein